jgi:hypothetical protein
MSRNFYILAATLFFFTLVSFALMWSNLNPQTGNPGDAALWKTIGLVMLLLSLLAALFGTFAGMYTQTRRRFDNQQDKQQRRRR